MFNMRIRTIYQKIIVSRRMGGIIQLTTLTVRLSSRIRFHSRFKLLNHCLWKVMEFYFVKVLKTEQKCFYFVTISEA